MGWNITPVNFEMVLDTGIPEFIGDEVNEIVQKASEKFKIDPSAIDKWAVHPGGKKILEAVHKSLGFTNGQLQNCYAVLKEYGNMSSPTVLFVLEKIMQQSETKAQGKIFGAAFGPGITMETFILSA